MTGLHDQVHEVRDPLYGFVKLSGAEWQLVNCPEFQRLRDIRQLAMGYMVYPGANHTRFEHSIGCVHLSTLIFDVLTERDQEILESEFQLSVDARNRARQLLRLAALVHDIGHPPFSHIGESLAPFEIDQSGKAIVDAEGNPQRSTHEAMTARIVRESEIGEKIRTLFGPRGIGVEEVVAVATDFSLALEFDRHPYHEFLQDLLAGELGSDRVDYLLRDAYHSGQKSGEFDYRRLVSCVTMVPAPKETEDIHRIGFDSGGWLVAEQMIVARYLMYQSLYFHKTKRIYEIHLEEFMKAWLDEQGLDQALPSTVAGYVRLSDSDVLSSLHKAARDENHRGFPHARRFIDRSHLRLAHELILADNLDPDSERRLPCRRRFDKLRKDVRIKFGNSVLCDQPDHSATKIFGDTHKVLVTTGGRPRYLDAVSEIVRGMSSQIWRGRVYAEPEQREEVSRWCKRWLEENPVEGFKSQTEQDNAEAKI